MKIGRIERGNQKVYVSIEEDHVQVLAGCPLTDGIRPTGETLCLKDMKLLAPVDPGKIIAIGVNYLDHAKEMGDDVHEDPIIFMKPPSAVIGPDDEIERPRGCEMLDYEAEMALVIGKKCRNASAAEADDYIFGFTCCNDVTARDIQRLDGQWTRGKSFDTFCPLGPWIETDFCWKDVQVSSRLNGETRQNGRTSMMMNKVDRLVEFVSSVMTLNPGDVITTGTPEGVGHMNEGDVIEIEVEGIGTLKNRVKK